MRRQSHGGFPPHETRAATGLRPRAGTPTQGSRGAANPGLGYRSMPLQGSLSATSTPGPNRRTSTPRVFVTHHRPSSTVVNVTPIVAHRRPSSSIVTRRHPWSAAFSRCPASSVVVGCHHRENHPWPPPIPRRPPARNPHLRQTPTSKRFSSIAQGSPHRGYPGSRHPTPPRSPVGARFTHAPDSCHLSVLARLRPRAQTPPPPNAYLEEVLFHSPGFAAPRLPWVTSPPHHTGAL